MVGKPFRKPFYTNFWFTACVVALTTLNLLLLFNPFTWEWIYPNANGDTADEPITMIISRVIHDNNFQYMLFIIVLINTVLTMVWERVVVRFVSLKWKEEKRQKKLLLEKRN